MINKKANIATKQLTPLTDNDNGNISRNSYLQFKDLDPYLVSNSGETKTFSFVTYNAIVDNISIRYNNDADWVTIGGITQNSITVTVNPSHYIEDRTATIVVKWHDTNTSEQYITELDITQEKGETYFNIPNKNVGITSISQGFAIPIETFTDDITLTSNVSWLTARFNPPMTQIIMTATENNNAERTGLITVSSNGYSETITVTQSENKERPNIYFEPETLTINNNIGDIFYIYFNEVNGDTLRRLTLGFNINYTATIDRANNRIKIEVIKQNNTKETNTTTILAQGGEMTRVHTLTVKQPSMYDVHFEPNELRFEADGTPYINNYSFLNIEPSEIAFYEWIETETPDWYKLTWNDTKNKATVIDVLPNEVATERRFTETLQVTLQNDIEMLCDITIIQDGREPYIETSIWRDTLYTFESGRYSNNTNYRLLLSGKEIYRGKLYFIDDTCTIRINNIVGDYMSVNDNPFLRIYNDNNAYINVMLQTSTDGNVWYNTQEYYFYYDYSYEPLLTLEKKTLTKPIQDYIDKRCYFLYTMQDYYSDATNTKANISLYRNGSIDDFSYTIKNQAFTWCIPLDGDCEDIQVSVENGSIADDRTIKIVDTCKNYCLYYLQNNGGWSWLMINGKTVKKDNITSNYITKNAINYITTAFSKYKYLLTKSSTYELYTDYLNDEQAELITELFSSPIVYLHDLKKDTLIAVNITDTSVEHKSFKNLNRKFPQYKITVEESKKKSIK